MSQTVTLLQPRLRLEDPHDCTDANDVLALFDALYDGLVRLNEAGGYRPALAETWTVSPDARLWRFTLREGLTFHDGTLCRAADVVASLTRMARPDKGYTLGAPGVWHQYLGDAAITAPDARTVEIALTRPIADLLDILVYGYVVAPAALARYEAGDMSAPLGTGPYRLVSQAPGAVELARFDGWHGPAPKNARLRVELESDAARRLDRLRRGEVALANSLDFTASEALDGAAGFTRAVSLVPVAIIYLFNAARGPLAHPAVRRALNLAIDRQALADGVVHGAARPLHGFVSPLHFGCDALRLLPHDPAEARRLLAEAGHGDGLVIDVDCPTRLPDEAEALTTAVADQLAAIGVRFSVHRHEDREAYAHGVRLNRVRDMCVFDSSPLSTFRILAEKIDARVAGSWWLGYHNGAVEALIDRGRQTVDDGARAEIYRAAYRLLQDDPAWLTLYNPLRVTGLAGAHPHWTLRRDGILDVTTLPDFSAESRP